MKKIEIKLPKGFMNCAITICNNFTSNTNDSANWDTICFPLPDTKGNWVIESYEKENIVLLIEKLNK